MELKVTRPAGAHWAPRKCLWASALSLYDCLIHTYTHSHSPTELASCCCMIIWYGYLYKLMFCVCDCEEGKKKSLFVCLCASVLSWSHWKSPLIAIIHPHTEISLNFSYPLPAHSPTTHTKQTWFVAMFLWFAGDLQQCHGHINRVVYTSRTSWWILSTAVDLWRATVRNEFRFRVSGIKKWFRPSFFFFLQIF